MQSYMDTFALHLDTDRHISVYIRHMSQQEMDADRQISLYMGIKGTQTDTEISIYGHMGIEWTQKN